MIWQFIKNGKKKASSSNVELSRLAVPEDNQGKHNMR